MLLSAPAGQPGGSVELDLSWGAQYWLLPAAGESILARFNCLSISAGVALDQHGAPSATSAAEVFTVVPAFKGAGTLVLTSRRLIGLLLMGSSLQGEVDGNRGQLLAFQLALREMSEVALIRKRGTFSSKETGIWVGCKDESLLAADLDQTISEQRRPSKTDRAAVTRQIVAAAAEAQRPHASTGEEQAMLERALSGQWEESSDELIARLPAPISLPAASERQQRDADDAA